MLQLDSWWKKALAGMLGAVANEAVRLYLVGIGQQSGPFIPPDVSAYVAGTIIYLLLAGGVTFLWDDPNPIKCLAVGAGLPRIIQSLAQSGIQIPRTSLLLAILPS